MIDLTHSNLVTFIKAEIQAVISKNPRFRKNFGEVQHAFGNTIHFSQGDVRVVVTNVSGQGTRLSPDNFLCTLMGRACAARIEGKEGAFIEWTKESDPDGEGLVPGFYYLNVADVHEGTGCITFDSRFMRWVEHRNSAPVQGTLIFVNPKWSLKDVQIQGCVPLVDYIHMPLGLQLRTYQESIVLTQGSEVLTPGVDWFILRHERKKIADTTGGQQVIQDMGRVVSLMHLEDQDGYLLREGSDFTWESDGSIMLSLYTPPQHEVYAVGDFLLDPGTVPLIHPENQIIAKPQNQETLVQKEVLYRVGGVTHKYEDVVFAQDGTMWFKYLAEPGDRIFWELRYQEPLKTQTAEKMTVTRNLVPGVQVALGDQVMEGDQAVVIVFPSVEETYEVYGSKENVTFDLEIHSNDLMTSSEMASILRNMFLIQTRDRFEAAGLTIFEVSRSYRGEQKDVSGTVAKHVVTLNITAAADWEWHNPLITRVDEIREDGVEVVKSFYAKPLIDSRAKVFGRTRFSQGFVPY